MNAEWDERAAHDSLARTTQLLEHLGLQYVSMEPWSAAIGAALAWGETEFLVLSVSFGSPGTLYITAGVLKDLQQEALPILTLCNQRNQNNPAYCVFLHDAEAGWDVLIQHSFPVQLLLDVPPFFKASLEPTTGAAAEARAEFSELGLGGMPHRWCDEDRKRLLMRSIV
jgi:hypothetical protein